MKLILCLIIAGLTGCTSQVEAIGETQQALTKVVHGSGDWWRPPEWTYTPAGSTLTASWSVGDNSPTAGIPVGTAWHCGSVKVTVFIIGTTECGVGNITNISVNAGFTLGLLHSDILDLYWQLPGGGAWTTVSLGIVDPNPDAFGWTHYTLNVPNQPVTGTTWTKSDLGCQGPPLVGFCAAGEQAGGTTIFADELFLTVTYTHSKQQG